MVGSPRTFDDCSEVGCTELFAPLARQQRVGDVDIEIDADVPNRAVREADVRAARVKRIDLLIVDAIDHTVTWTGCDVVDAGIADSDLNSIFQLTTRPFQLRIV